MVLRRLTVTVRQAGNHLAARILSHDGHFVRQFGQVNVAEMCCTLDGRRLVTANPRADVEVWDLHSGELICRYKFAMDYVESISLSATGLLAVAANMYNAGGEIRVIRLADGATLKSMPLFAPEKVCFVRTRHNQEQDDLYFHETRLSHLYGEEEPPLFQVSASMLSITQYAQV